MFVVRDDIAGQACSRYLSRKSGIYHLVSDKAKSEWVAGAGKAFTTERVHTPIDISEKDLSRELLSHTFNISIENARWRAFFRRYGIKPFILRLENVANDCRRRLDYIDKLIHQTGVKGWEGKKERSREKLVSPSHEIYNIIDDFFLSHTQSFVGRQYLKGVIKRRLQLIFLN